MAGRRIAMLFPGQGSQRAGMGADLAARWPWVTERWLEPADALLGFGLARLCLEGPEEALRRTENTQPAVFLLSMVVLDVLRAEGVEPAAAAGHSLGEYAALVAAGALRWQDALLLVRRRGELMAAVDRDTPGAMAAVIGLEPAAVERACAVARQGGAGVVEVANYNEPAQTVVSGEVAAVERASALAQEAGADRVVPLPVGAPFHCSLMRPVRAALAAELDRCEVRDPALPVVANATGDYVRTAAEVRAALCEQVAAPVRWSDGLRRLVADGCDTFVEVGPGRVLTALCARIDPGVDAAATGDARRLDALLARVRAA